jgi:hypothetical protein
MFSDPIIPLINIRRDATVLQDTLLSSQLEQPRHEVNMMIHCCVWCSVIPTGQHPSFMVTLATLPLVLNPYICYQCCCCGGCILAEHGSGNFTIDINILHYTH